MQAEAWTFTKPDQPMSAVRRDLSPGPEEVLVAGAGCGVCHTDLGFYFDGVPTRHALPLVLGHEISGRVVASGPGAESWKGRSVIVPAVIPCGACEACLAGREARPTSRAAQRGLPRGSRSEACLADRAARRQTNPESRIPTLGDLP